MSTLTRRPVVPVSLAPYRPTYEVALCRRPYADVLEWIESHTGPDHGLSEGKDANGYPCLMMGSRVWAEDSDVIVNNDGVFDAITYNAFCAIFGQHQWLAVLRPQTTPDQES